MKKDALIPAAIILAGILIGTGIFFGLKSKGPAEQTTEPSC